MRYNHSSKILGGGFCFPALKGHVRFWNECLKFLNPKSDFVIAALEYGMERLLLTHKHFVETDQHLGLTKETRYPVQIIQGTEALRFILDKGYDASNVCASASSSR